MYGWIWRNLPGGIPMKTLLALILAVSVVVILFKLVFPWLEPRLPFGDITVDETTTGARAAVAGLSR